MRRLRARHTGAADDAALAARAQAGDHEAFTTLLRRHDEAMRRLAFRILADRAAMDDALQEAYVKAYRSIGTFRQDAAFGSWLYRITYNACIDELRHRRHTPVADVPDRPSNAPGPERTATAAEVVRVALAQLPADQRATVALVDGEGFDHDGAAEVLGVAPGTIASRLSRARAALRLALEEITE